MSFEEGPFVQVACFCDMVLRDETGAFSLIRIIDTLNHVEGGPEPPDTMPTVSYSLKLVLSLKSGKARGRYDLKVIPELPTGESKEPMTVTTHFEGEEKGHNVVANIKFDFEIEGLYWFDVFIGANRLTRIPFRVKYNRVITPQIQR